MTLPELLVTLVILAILSTAMLRLVVSQTRSVDRQIQQRSARAVGRSSVNYLLSELRMVEPGGVLAASPTQVDVRVPYALGLSCGSLGRRTVVSLLPVDSAVYADALFSGYAWRDPGGTYTYVDTSIALASSAAVATCAGARITTLPAGRLVEIEPALPASAAPGSPILLVQRLQYRFGPSHDVPGSWALFRTRVLDGVAEELASPFDSTAHFRFYRAGADTAETTPPATLGTLRGLELDFTSMSVRPRLGGTQPERAPQQASIFFGNAQP